MEIKCNGCGSVVPENAAFCPACGRRMTESIKAGEDDVVSIWTYIWMTIVFSMPVVGLIISIVMAFAPQKSVNLTNFARAYMIIDIVITILLGLFICFAVLVLIPLAGTANEFINDILDKLLQI